MTSPFSASWLAFKTFTAASRRMASTCTGTHTHRIAEMHVYPYRLQSSSFLGLPYRIPKYEPQKELL